MLYVNTAIAVRLLFHYIKEKVDISTANWQLTPKQCSWTKSTTRGKMCIFDFVLNCSFNNLKGGTQIKPHSGLCSSPQTD